MKKTLMVLTFALCATFVFAQTATPRMGKEYKASAKVANVQTEQQSSIFTKDVTPLFSCDFHAANVDYSTGIVSGGLEGHGENYDYATWRRWPDADSLTLVGASNTYSTLAQSYFGSVERFASYMMQYLDTATSSAENGWMMMSMYDQTTRNSGNFNAYILFENISTSGATVVDVNFFQYYRKYYDNCYVDYTTNGTTWNEMEINVRGVDVAVNGTLWGPVTYTLPLGAAGCPDMSFRIRYKSLNSSTRNAYGYYWIVDDVTLTAGDADRLKQYDQEYVEGNYGLLPNNFQVSPAWYTQVKNNGSNNQANVTATIYHLDATQTTATQISAYDNGAVNAGVSKNIITDKSGWLLYDSLDYRGWYGYSDHNPNGTGMAMPTATTGDNYMYATVSNSNVNLTYDTMYYNVTTADANGDYRWGHDNGVLVYSPYNYWMYGYVQSQGTWFVTDDPEEVHYYQSGYIATSRYTTDVNVPTDWVIRGVEIVASPVDGYHSTGAKLSAILWKDIYDGGSVSFSTVNTGANIKEVAASDINDSNAIGRNSNGYLTLGNYNTVTILFPEQPALEANTSYRIGYSMEEEGYFAPAAEATGSYRMASPTRPEQYDTIIYFKNSEATAKWSHFYAPNQYQNYINDPSYGGDGNSGTFAFYQEVNPMIRMLIGPAHQVNRYNISVSCENDEFGEAIYAGQEACGETITPVEHSTAAIVGYAATGCRCIVTVDGEEVEPWDEDTEEGNPNLVISYDQDSRTYAYIYTFADITENHEINFNFYESGDEPEGIDPVAAGVRMNLQPNPATSQVNLNIEGVNGMVNCMLIDMSGRVVYNQNINAESAQVINLSNLAKGAYFVRITNDKFSKVEKLIVR